jgi:RNA polymerase sigma-70 factor (ECF subfamily)
MSALPARSSTPASAIAATDHVLFERIRASDEAAFAQMFSAYYPALCRFTSSFVWSSEVAKELVQDVFFRIWEQRDALQIRGSLRAYLFGAARNHAVNFLKHERVGNRIFETATAEHRVLAIGRGFDSPDEALYHGELVAAFETAVDNLPERQRTILVLRWHHQLTHAEIAEALGISVKGVETQLGRAIKTLRAQLTTFR